MNENFSDILKNINLHKVLKSISNRLLYTNFSEFRHNLGYNDFKIYYTLSLATKKVLNHSFYRLKSSLPGIQEESCSMSYKSGYLTNNMICLSKLLSKLNTDQKICKQYFSKWNNYTKEHNKKSNLYNQLSLKKQPLEENEKCFKTDKKGTKKLHDKFEWSNLSNFTKRINDDDDCMSEVSNSFDIISLKFKCAFKNLKKNYYIVKLQCINKWIEFKNCCKQDQTTTFKTIFDDMTKTKTCNNKELLNYKMIKSKQNNYCKIPPENYFNDHVNILINHAYILGNFEFEIQVLKGNNKDMLKFVKIFKLFYKFYVLKLSDYFSKWVIEFQCKQPIDKNKLSKVYNKSLNATDKTEEINVEDIMNITTYEKFESSNNFKIFLDYVDYLEKLVHEKYGDKLNCDDEKENYEHV